MRTRLARRLGVSAVLVGFAAAALFFAAAGGNPSLRADDEPAVGQGEVKAKAVADWNQWRGPNRDGVSNETNWLTKWPKDGPKVLWKKSIGAGFSTVAVSDGRAYTMGNRKNVDTVFCFDVKSGREIWKKSYKCKLGEYKGPRATPTVDGGRVYTLSREGHLRCWDARTGRRRWGKNIRKDFGPRPATWGFAGSPLVHGKLLIVDVGTVLALDKIAGNLVWKSPPFKAGYSSPVVFKLGKRELIASFNADGLLVVSAADGSEIGKYRWKTAHDVNAVTPIISGDKVFISSGYGTGCALFQVGKGNPKLLWKNKSLRTHFNSCVLWKGHLYGFDTNVLKCMEFANGNVKWSRTGLGKGSLMIADGKLIILSERGKLTVAEASHAGFKLVAQAQVLSGRCWTMPVLSGGRIFCRNNVDSLVCLDVRKK